MSVSHTALGYFYLSGGLGLFKMYILHCIRPSCQVDPQENCPALSADSQTAAGIVDAEVRHIVESYCRTTRNIRRAKIC